MASKLEKHEKFILDALERRFSYSAIAKSLADMGCKTSPQNVFVWVRNRAAKLQARRALINPPALLPQQCVPAVTVVPVKAIAPLVAALKATGPLASVGQLTKEEELRQLNELMETEKKGPTKNLLDRKK